MLTIEDKFVITDIETNGLLDTATKFWCGWIYNSETDEYKGYTNLNEYWNALNWYGCNAYNIVFHNGIRYDVPASRNSRTLALTLIHATVCLTLLYLLV